MTMTKEFVVMFFPILFFTYLLNFCTCFNEESHNISATTNGFLPAVATWYGNPTGAGSGGACGFANDVAGANYRALISAGNRNLYKSGFGCGSCYQVRCTTRAPCSGFPVTVTITDECPGTCNNEAFHFDLSGTAFGALAKPGQENDLRQLGRIDVEYQRVPCNYGGTYITFKIDGGSNQNYLAFAIEYVSQDGTLGFVELQPSGGNQWLPMKQTFGATWNVGITPGQTNPPFSVRMTTGDSKRVIIAQNVIPVNWAPGQYYVSHVQ